MRDETDESSLARWLRRSRSAETDPEPADFGTAFGLDASMGSAKNTDAPPAAGDAGPSTDRLNRRSVI